MKKNVSAAIAAACAAVHHKRAQHTFFHALFILLLAVSILPVQAQTQNFAILHEFNGLFDGAHPEGVLFRDAAGNLFGTTFDGGSTDAGVVYKIDSAGTETTLFTFNILDGSNPASALVQDQAGNLYGIADEGSGGAGIVFKLSSEGAETPLFSFQGSLFGRNARVPTGGILRDKSGNIFGTTLFGGNGSCQSGCGTVFRLDTAGLLHVLHNFSGKAGGSQPFGALLQDTAGNLYGVAKSGGDLSCPEFPQAGCGIVFKLAKNGAFTVLHTFQGGSDGAVPQPGLVSDPAGNLFGTASRGGNSENGLVFKISTTGQYAVLHRFTGKDGSTPNGALVLDPAGNLFGTTQTGGIDALGTVFELTPARQLKVLHSFTGDLDGAFPLAGLIRDDLGHLFGTAVKNFLSQQMNGVVFEIRP